jgi:hypothetical protein
LTFLTAAKTRAKKLGVPFDLTVEDIVVPDRCPVLGMAITHQYGKRAADFSPSLDRIIPALGYVKGNVRIISWRANYLKNNGTADEFEAIARYIREKD